MNKRIYLWVFISLAILVAGMLSGFILLQPSVQDLLVQILESVEAIQDGHAVLAVNVDTLEKESSGTIEVWGQRGDGGTGAFRLEVLQASDEKAAGAVIVSDGETIWAYSPSENQVLVGTLEEAKAMMATKEFEGLDFMDRDFHKDGDQDGEAIHPKNAEEAVQKLMEYFNVSKSGSDTVANAGAQILKLEPIPGQMPAEYTAVGGYLNLWIDKDLNVPLGAAFTGSSFGDVSVTALELEINQGVDETLFTFDVPTGVEIISFADLEPHSLSLEEAKNSAEINLLSPSETPEGATLVDILEIRGAIVQRYTLPGGGSFTVLQASTDGKSNVPSPAAPSAEMKAVEVRGVAGTLLTTENGSKVLLTWTEGDLVFSVTGDLSADQALAIAESLE